MRTGQASSIHTSSHSVVTMPATGPQWGGGRGEVKDRQFFEGVDHTGFLPLPKFCIDFSLLRIVVSFHRNRGESSLSLES